MTSLVAQPTYPSVALQNLVKLLMINVQKATCMATKLMQRMNEVAPIPDMMRQIAANERGDVWLCWCGRRANRGLFVFAEKGKVKKGSMF